MAGEEGETGTTGQKVLITNKQHQRELQARVTKCELILQSSFLGRYWIYGDPWNAWRTRRRCKEMNINEDRTP